MSRLTYASNAIYPSLMARNMDALTRMTKAAIRPFFCFPPWTSTAGLFERLCLPTLEDALAAKILIFVRRCIHGRSSVLFRNYYARTQSDRTRGADQNLLQVPFWPGPSGRGTIQFIGAILWNKTPPMMRCEHCHAHFRALSKASKYSKYTFFLSCHQWSILRSVTFSVFNRVLFPQIYL